MIRVEVKFTGDADPLGDLLSVLTDPEMKALNTVAGRAARNEAARYTDEFDATGGWRNPKYGTGRSRFGANVTAGWHLSEVTADKTVIANNADHYAFRVSGGTITPKRAGALTIPAIPEARGMRASVYQQNTGRKLFTIRGKKALFERIDDITTGERGKTRRSAGATQIRTSNIRPVYWLVQSVTQPPMPDGAPGAEVIGEAFGHAWRDEMIRKLDSPK